MCVQKAAFSVVSIYLEIIFYAYKMCQWHFIVDDTFCIQFVTLLSNNLEKKKDYSDNFNVLLCLRCSAIGRDNKIVSKCY